MRLTGVVQENIELPDQARCDMVLRVLGTPERIPISQKLGDGSEGCRLDPGGLETAAGLVETALTRPTDLLIVNKFGKQELDGRGFRPLIAQALSQDIAVLLSVGRTALPGFLEFAGEVAVRIAADADALVRWASAEARVA